MLIAYRERKAKSKRGQNEGNCPKESNIFFEEHSHQGQQEPLPITALISSHYMWQIFRHNCGMEHQGYIYVLYRMEKAGGDIKYLYHVGCFLCTKLLCTVIKGI